MNHLQETSTKLVEEKNARSLKMDEIRERLGQLKLATAQNQEATIQAEKKDAEYNARIANAEKTCRELVVFDPADLAALRGQYNVLVMTHSWKPLELSSGKQTWLFDDIIEAQFTNQGDSFLLKTKIYEKQTIDKSMVKQVHSLASREILESLSPSKVCLAGLTQIATLLKLFDKSHGVIGTNTDIKQVLQDIAITWESCKTLFRDIQMARHFTSAPVELVTDELFKIKTKFLNVEKRTHVEATFSFSTTNGMLYYPYGQWSFDYTTTYGHAEYVTGRANAF
ncbi:hypothetical protein HDU91_004565 [Kappamyces sp. JEL0680]|nr:hypothetical protein HDU91_004565 [Kappamyces sp. JEL0680]